ncbi:hypothetical protein [Streptomyces sp. NBC_01497]|uniref:hypothetical protein n=1 Tax=Streptomyces sp. NBC_01497 TaxID=2903885 RepID=UPI002E2F367B|nr:hypothetical protein [Streptomyces sp. NBC_01497]
MSVTFRSAAFRPLVTAGAAGVMLCGLFFIPTAHGGVPRGETPHRTGQAAVSQDTGGTPDAADAAGSPSAPGSGAARSAVFAGQNTRASRQLALGETPASDATPYVVGGAGVLCVGAAFVTRAMRRRDGAA